MSLTLVVLRCADLQASRAFYEALGLEFVEEQHGAGPVHYAATVGATVLELYPARDGAASPVRLGLTVNDIKGRVGAVTTAGGRLLSDSGSGRFVVEDPDGVAVELRESP